MQAQALRQALGQLLHGIGRKIGAVDVHVVQIAAHLVDLNAANQVHAGDERAHQKADEQDGCDGELDEFLAPFAAVAPCCSHLRFSSPNPCAQRVTEFTPAG